MAGTADFELIAVAPESSEWFFGGLVRPEPRIKYEIFGVSESPVISETTACAIAGELPKLRAPAPSLSCPGQVGPVPRQRSAGGNSRLDPDQESLLGSGIAARDQERDDRPR